MSALGDLLFPDDLGLADRMRRAMKHKMDAALFLGDTEPVQENQMTEPETRHCHADWSGPCKAEDCPIAGQMPHACPGAPGPQHAAMPEVRQCSRAFVHEPHPWVEAMTGGAPGPVPTTSYLCPGLSAGGNPWGIGDAPVVRKAEANATDPAETLENMTEAERLGLIVGAAYGTALAERDAARDLAARLEQQNAEANRLLDLLVAGWPDTSWAQDSAYLERVVQGIETMRALGSDETDDQDKVDG